METQEDLKSPEYTLKFNQIFIVVVSEGGVNFTTTPFGGFYDKHHEALEAAERLRKTLTDGIHVGIGTISMSAGMVIDDVSPGHVIPWT